MHPFPSLYLDPGIFRTSWLLRTHSLPINILSGLATAFPAVLTSHLSLLYEATGNRSCDDFATWLNVGSIDHCFGLSSRSIIFSPYPQCTPLSRVYRIIHDSANVYVIIQPWFPISLTRLIWRAPTTTRKVFWSQLTLKQEALLPTSPPSKPYKNDSHIPPPR